MILGKLFPTRLILGVVALFLGYQGFVMMMPEPPRVTASEQRAFESAADTLADELSRKIKKNSAMGIAHFLNDPIDKVTAIVRNKLIDAEENAQWEVREGSVVKHFLSDVSSTVAQATTLDEVVNAGRRVGLDIVVGGQVQDITHHEDSVTVKVRAVAYDLRQGEVVVNQNISAVFKGDELTDTSEGEGQGLLSGVKGWLVWLGCLLALPWLTGYLVRIVMEKESNTASAILLTGYTACDLGLAWLLVGFPATMPAGIIGALLVIALCGLYNYWACEKIA